MRHANTAQHNEIKRLLRAGLTCTEIVAMTGAYPGTVTKVRKQLGKVSKGSAAEREAIREAYYVRVRWAARDAAEARLAALRERRAG